MLEASVLNTKPPGPACHAVNALMHFIQQPWSWGQSCKADFGINSIKNGFNKLNFTLNYINFDVIYAKKSFIGLTPELGFQVFVLHLTLDVKLTGAGHFRDTTKIWCIKDSV